MVAFTKYIGMGGTATLLGLLLWFSLSYHFELELEGDKICAGTFENPCEASYNITLVNPLISVFYIQNKDRIKLEFIPDVKASYSCKKDGRYSSKVREDRERYPCGVGWREFDWKTPLTSRYNYINKFYRNKKQEFKIVVFKYNPSDTIKWGGSIVKEEFDPVFIGVSAKSFTEEIEIVPNIYDIRRCENKSVDVLDKCGYTYYQNYTFINNKTGINETRANLLNLTVDCNPHKIYYKDNCKTIGIKTANLKAMCPIGHRCNVEELTNEWCWQRCDGGDCNYNFKQNKDHGWDGGCILFSDLKEGEISTSSHKNTKMRVDKI